jgi:hypothetical protein
MHMFRTTYADTLAQIGSPVKMTRATRIASLLVIVLIALTSTLEHAKISQFSWGETIVTHHKFLEQMYVTHAQHIHKHMVNNRQTPWSKIIKNHGQTIIPDMLARRIRNDMFSYILPCVTTN